MDEANRLQHEPHTTFKIDQLRVWVYPDRETLGSAAAAYVSALLNKWKIEERRLRVVFAAAPSQNEFLDHLAGDRELDWSTVDAFHMDEYLGLNASHPASFRRYLADWLYSRVPLGKDAIFLMRGEDTQWPARIAIDYEALLRTSPIDLVCGGIGENGHLAFNDPGMADFEDPTLVKIVRLDQACRLQQVNDGCFSEISEVPTHAITMTIPALLGARYLSVVVPGERKADAVYAALNGPISETCPASILRTHPGAMLFLDFDSARGVL